MTKGIKIEIKITEKRMTIRITIGIRRAKRTTMAIITTGISITIKNNDPPGRPDDGGSKHL
jgi:hypothetical protein